MMGVVFLTALGVRLLALIAFQGTPFSDVLLVDARWHHEWAAAWAQGRWHMDDTAFFRAPLYPFWLSRLYQLFGPDPDAVRWVQAVLGSGTAGLLGGAVARLWGGRYGLAAGLLVALYGPFVYFDLELLIPNLLLFLLAGSLFAASFGKRPRYWAPASLLLGLAVIARPNVVFLLPAWAGWWWYCSAGWERRVRLSSAAAFLLLTLAPAAGVSWLNYRAEEAVVPVASQGGINFYAGNNPEATGRDVVVPEFGNVVNWREFLPLMQQTARERMGHPLNSGEVSRYWMQRGVRWVENHPAEALRLYVRKAYYLLSGFEIANNRSPYFKPPLPLHLLVWKTQVFAFPGGLVIPLALVGFGLLLRRAPSLAGGRFLLGAAALYAVSLLPFFICSRFRLPLVLLLIPGAAWALVHWREVLRPRPLALGLALVVVLNAGWFEANAQQVTEDRTKLGAALFERGETRRAAEVLEQALQESPGNLGAAFWLAHVYSALGRPADAIPLYRDLVGARPEDAALWFQLGTSYWETGDPASALEPLRQAVRFNPKDFRYHVNLGAAQEANGLAGEAEQSYRRAIALEPEHPLARRRLADLQSRSNAEHPSAH